MARSNKTDIYRKRQTAFLVIIGTILVIGILIAVYFIAFNDRKDISQTTGASGTEAVPADAQGETMGTNKICFETDSIQLAVGDKVTPAILNGNISDITNWQSSDSTVAVVSENGEISGISVGIAAVTAEVSDTGTLLTLKVDVVASENSGNLTANNYEIVERDGLTYVYDILIANKTYSLPSDYNPGEDEEAVAAFETMQSDAENEGLEIYISSGFRSYDDQDRIYNNYASYDGYEAADRYSARPGHSEHQTGQAFDLNTISESFAYTAEGEWVKENCHKYGFIIRYPEGKEDITGYMYEPWHIRYIGIDKATEVYESGLTLEEFLGIDSVYSE
ncbi:MAG: D-alanyl-D-alanine carboxypeptidase family protein [Ruminococcus sp.]|nr:D-alanyl-D-alanine carboxypeptidase family protein [Ruminococcus sp.]